MLRAATLALVFACTGAAGAKKPIVTTDIIYGTGELIYDVYGTIYNKFAAEHVSKGSAAIQSAIAPHLPKDILGEVCSKVGVPKSEVLSKIKAAQDTYVQAKVFVTEKVALAEAPLNSAVKFVVDHFEAFLPAYKGVVPKTIGDFTVFAIYIAFVLYVLVKIILFALRFAFGIFWFVFLCGCCRRGRPVKAEGKPAPKKAAANGKAPTNSPAPKAAADAKKKAK